MKDKPTEKKTIKVSMPESEKRDAFKFHHEECLNTESRTIVLSGVIGRDVGFELVDAAMTALELDSRKDITIKIFSPGGSVYEALAMVGRITDSPCSITTEGYGAIMSAAVLVLGCGDHRRMSRFATFMHHASSYQVGGSHEEVKEEVAQMERDEDMWCGWMDQLSKLTAKQWRKKSHKKNLYLNADETLKTGIIDEVF